MGQRPMKSLIALSHPRANQESTPTLLISLLKTDKKTLDNRFDLFEQ